MTSDHTVLADSVRAVVMGMAFVLYGQSIAIVWFYLDARRLAAKAMPLPGTRNRQMGLLPTHVILISVSFLVLVAECAIHTWARVGSEITFWAWFNLGAFMLAALALWEVVAFERTRINEARRMIEFSIDPPQEVIGVDEDDHHTERRPEGT